ncbi:probable protein CURVATURE THYLAKOID 1A, chloroplastic at C-terminar half [Coccomyxa sp. Obi]|nr:probable protein CURVATURE THYLAKOID 1A, chloroplastic at C-terminar half [Coccomyxa sp. Obi]
MVAISVSGSQTVTSSRTLGRGIGALRLSRRTCRTAMPLRQPVTARSFKTREGGITEKQIDQSDEISEKAQEFASDLKAKWDDLDEKPAAVAITISVFVAIWAASGVVDAVDRLPIIGGLLEFVGLLVTGWFAYRYLIFGPDREELKSNIESFLKKVTGKSQV